MTDYNIERVNQLEEVLKCVPFEQEIRNKGRDSGRISDMLMLVNSMLDNPLFGFWIAYDDDRQPLGYVVAMVTLGPGQHMVLLLRIYAKDKKLREQFEDILIEWGKEYKIKKCTMIIHETRNVKIFERKGWKVTSMSMEKSVRDILRERNKK